MNCTAAADLERRTALLLLTYNDETTWNCLPGTTNCPTFTYLNDELTCCWAGGLSRRDDDDGDHDDDDEDEDDNCFLLLLFSMMMMMMMMMMVMRMITVL